MTPEQVPDREHVAAVVLASTVQIETPLGFGSGWVAAENTIVTAAHVLRPSGNTPVLVRHGALECPEVKRWVDPVRDLAVLEVEGCASLMPLMAATMAPLPGSAVYAAGHPFGWRAASINAGIVSARPSAATLQIDAAANPGMSGGPIVDEYGRVVATISSLHTRDGLFAGVVNGVPAWPED